MLLLPCEYRHVHEQQGCATLPRLSIGETEVQWTVPQGDARPIPFPVSSRPSWANWLLFCGAGGRGAAVARCLVFLSRQKVLQPIKMRQEDPVQTMLLLQLSHIRSASGGSCGAESHRARLEFCSSRFGAGR